MNEDLYMDGFRAGIKSVGGEKIRGSSILPTAAEMMLCWDPETSNVALVPWPDECGRSSKYENSTLACWSFMQKATFEQRKTICFIEAIHLIVRDKCDPLAVHNALLGLQEYRDGCSDDMPGL